MQNNTQNEERVRPRLASANELKGRKTAKKPSNIRKRRLTAIVALTAVLACIIGGYFAVQALKPAEEPEQASTSSSTITQTIEGRKKQDVAKVTVYWDGEKQYTIVSNLRAKAEAAEKESEKAQDAPAPTAEPIPADQAESGLADGIRETLDNVTGVMNIGDKLNGGEEEEDAIPLPTELPEPDPIIPDEPEPVDIASLPDYQVEGMPWFQLKNSQANNMIVYGFTMTASRVIEENAEDMAVYGLDKPQVQVVFEYHDGTTMTINVGNKIPAGNYYYVTLDDSRTVYMVHGNIYSDNHYALESLFQLPTLTQFDIDNCSATSVLIEQRGKETIEMVMEDTKGETTSISSWMMVQPVRYGLNTDRSAEMEKGIAGIALTGFAAYAPDEASLAGYGLTDPYAHLAMADSQDRSCEFVIGDYVEGADSLRYVTIDDSGIVYTMDTSLLAFLSNARVSYVVDQFANLVYIKRINGFEITTPDTVYTAVVEHYEETNDKGETKDKERFIYEGEPAEEDIFRDFYQVVIGTLFDKRIEDASEWHLEGDAEVTVTYHLTYTDEPYVVEYVSYDRDYYAIRKEGVTLFLIRKEKVQNVIDTAESYRQGTYTGANDTYEY